MDSAMDEKDVSGGINWMSVSPDNWWINKRSKWISSMKKRWSYVGIDKV